MPRYIKQNDDYSCGAYAVFNTLQWQGKRVTKKIIPKIWKDSKVFFPVFGMPFECLENALKKSKIKWKFCYAPRIQEVDANLSSGKAMILAYYYGIGLRSKGHYTLCIGKSGKRYIMVNESMKKTIVRRNRKSLIKMLHVRYKYTGPNVSPKDANPRCWFIKRQ